MLNTYSIAFLKSFANKFHLGLSSSKVKYALFFLETINKILNDLTITGCVHCFKLGFIV